MSSSVCVWSSKGSSCLSCHVSGRSLRLFFYSPCWLLVPLLLMLKKLGVTRIHAHFFHMLIILSFLLLLIFSCSTAWEISVTAWRGWTPLCRKMRWSLPRSCTILCKVCCLLSTRSSWSKVEILAPPIQLLKTTKQFWKQWNSGIVMCGILDNSNC